MSNLTVSTAVDTLLQAADQAAIRTAAGLGSAATHVSGDFDAAGAAAGAQAAAATDATSKVATETSARATADALLVPRTTTVAGHALSGNVTLTRGDVGLGNVDNTADASKPVSTAQAAADSAVASTATTYTDGVSSSIRADMAANIRGVESDLANEVARAQAAEALLAPRALVENRQTGDYILDPADNGRLVAMDSTGANVLTVPLSTAVAIDIGFQCLVEMSSTGITTIAAEGGVTVNNVDGRSALKGQYALATLIKRDTDVWSLSGALA